MTSIELRLPAEVLAEIEIPYEGTRGVGDFSIAMEGVDFTASVVTLAALRPRIAAFASALRRWVLRRQRSTPVRLTIRGKGIDVKLDLPPNVSTAQIMTAIADLIDEDGVQAG